MQCKAWKFSHTEHKSYACALRYVPYRILLREFDRDYTNVEHIIMSQLWLRMDQPWPDQLDWFRRLWIWNIPLCPFCIRYSSAKWISLWHTCYSIWRLPLTCNLSGLTAQSFEDAMIVKNIVIVVCFRDHYTDCRSSFCLLMHSCSHFVPNCLSCSFFKFRRSPDVDYTCSNIVLIPKYLWFTTSNLWWKKKIDSGPYQHGKSGLFLLHILGVRLKESVLCMVTF